MADDSPGKVQQLRAIFSEKNHPVMGLMPPGVKIASRQWRSLENSTSNASLPPNAQEVLAEKKTIGDLNRANLINRVLPVPEKNPKPMLNGEDAHKNSRQDKLLLQQLQQGGKFAAKPLVGPKPSYLVQQQRNRIVPALSSESVSSNGSSSGGSVPNGDKRTNDMPPPLPSGKSSSSKSTVGETIASFMFTNGCNGVELGSPADKDTVVVQNGGDVRPPPLPSVPKPRISQLRNGLQSHVDILNFCNNDSEKRLLEGDDVQRCDLINSDNYICKSKCRVRKRALPPQEKLGPAPLKPIKPPHMKLPPKHTPPVHSSQPRSSSQVPPAVPPQRPPSCQRPAYPCPPRPVTSPPLPPVSVIKAVSPTSLREEIEELYEDTLLGGNKRPVSLIPEYTEEEEQAELYNDAAESYEENTDTSDSPYKHKTPALIPVPSEYLQPNNSGSNEELYQDANGNINEEFYEVMPCDEIQEDYGSPLYSNNKKEIEKLKKEEEKKLRKEQKEREKREKELEKLRKKFNLTGDEIPIDDGLVKCDSRGGKGDLAVKKGETVLILRMEGNPSGRWLVKNERGKIGYVELTNIEVMSIRRLSVISGEDLYCEAKSEEEGIYEVTY